METLRIFRSPVSSAREKTNDKIASGQGRQDDEEFTSQLAGLFVGVERIVAEDFARGHAAISLLMTLGVSRNDVFVFARSFEDRVAVRVVVVDGE